MPVFDLFIQDYDIKKRRNNICKIFDCFKNIPVF
jgi:hypothetical protein